MQVGKKIEQVLSSSQMLSLTLKKCSISFCQPKKNYAQPEAEKKIPCPRKLPQKKTFSRRFLRIKQNAVKICVGDVKSFYYRFVENVNNDSKVFISSSFFSRLNGVFLIFSFFFCLNIAPYLEYLHYFLIDSIK